MVISLTHNSLYGYIFCSSTTNTGVLQQKNSKSNVYPWLIKFLVTILMDYVWMVIFNSIFVYIFVLLRNI